MRFIRYSEILATGLLILVGLFGIAVNLLDLFINDSTWQIFKDAPTITLLVVSILALSLGLERVGHLRQVDNKLEQINNQLVSMKELMSQKFVSIETLVETSANLLVESLNGVNVKQFSSGQQMLEYVFQRIHEAKDSINDLTMGISEPAPTEADKHAMQQYLDAKEQIIAQGNVRYREIFSFPPEEHFQHLTSTFERRYQSYRFRYYTFVQQDLPSLMQFITIDDTEVIIAYYRAPYLSAASEVRLAIQNTKLVKLFNDYYETLWQGAETPLESDSLESMKERIKKRIDKRQLRRSS